MSDYHPVGHTAKKRAHPNAHRAGYLAGWIGMEIMKNGKEADRFAIIADRKTWMLIRTALRKFAKL